MPIGCMRCLTAIPLPAITGPRFPLHAYSWHVMFHSPPIFSMQHAAARLFAACDALSQPTEVSHLFAHRANPAKHAATLSPKLYTQLA